MFSQNNPFLNLLASSVSDWSNKEHNVNNNNSNNIIINEYNKEFRTNDLEICVDLCVDERSVVLSQKWLRPSIDTVNNRIDYVKKTIPNST